METKKYLKGQAYSLIIPLFAIAVGFIWPSFYWFGIGIIIAVIIFINTICCLFKHSRSEDNYVTGLHGGCALFIIAALFTLAYWTHDGTRYIIPNGKKLHLYVDCSTFPKGSNAKKVSELEGFFHRCFEDCEVCLKRKEAALEQARIEREKRWEEIAKVERNDMVEVLLDAIEELRNGADAESVGEELDEYLYDEGYCKRTYEEEHEDVERNWGIPSRYL